MRISIIGNCGSGKTTLARKISKKLNIPHIQLDRLWFEAGGQSLKKNDEEGREKVRDHIRRNVEDAIKQEAWVSDGWYSRVQPLIAERADEILFLDISLWRRLINHIHRVFWSERHPELTRWEDLLFTYEIVRRTFTQGPQIRQFIEAHPEKVITLRSYKQIEDHFRTLI